MKCPHAQKRLWVIKRKERKREKEPHRDLMPLEWECGQAVTEGEVVVIALLTGPSVNPSLEASPETRYGN